MMRLKYTKLITILIFLINIILLYYTWLYLVGESSKNSTSTQAIPSKRDKQKDRIQSTNKHIKKTITIIFRDFYHFENDLQHSIDSILNLIPNIQIFIIYDDEPYPPLSFISNYTIMHSNVKFINLNFDIRKTAKTLSPILNVRTRYVLFVPDSFRFGGRAIIQKMLKEISTMDIDSSTMIADDKLKKINFDLSGQKKIQENSRDSINGYNKSKIFALKTSIKKIIIVPFASNVKTMGNCCRIKLDFANWTMEYSVKNDTNDCDMYLQKHAILIDTNFLKLMPNPLAAPFPEMLYLQSKMAKAKLHMLTTGILQDGKRLFTAFHNKQRKKELRKQQFKEMYKQLQIKKVIRKFAGKSAAKIEKYRKQHEQKSLTSNNNNININNNNNNNKNLNNNMFGGDSIILSNTSLPLLTTVEYFGCEKNTKSCIGSVYDRKPFYVYLERNTPPCCMEKLKSVFNHVLDELENVGIRYWLDNHALKTAVETNQLDRNAYEIDLSFNAYDLERSTFLKKAQIRPLADAAGYYWFKATDGHYFRIQYSKQNQIGVNLLPFDINGDRVRANGFYGWKAKEFSAEFLHPMSTVLFLNKNVNCPNNVREFLELKNLNN